MACARRWEQGSHWRQDGPQAARQGDGDVRGDTDAAATAGAGAHQANRPDGGGTGPGGTRPETAEAAAPQGAGENAGGERAGAAGPHQYTRLTRSNAGTPAGACRELSDRLEAANGGPSEPLQPGWPSAREAHRDKAAGLPQDGLQGVGAVATTSDSNACTPGEGANATG